MMQAPAARTDTIEDEALWTAVRQATSSELVEMPCIGVAIRQSLSHRVSRLPRGANQEATRDKLDAATRSLVDVKASDGVSARRRQWARVRSRGRAAVGMARRRLHDVVAGPAEILMPAKNPRLVRSLAAVHETGLRVRDWMEPARLTDDDVAAARASIAATVQSLESNLNVELPDIDKQELAAEAVNSALAFRRAEATLSRFRPRLIVCWADTHTPYLEAVMAGRASGVPSLVIQHGLDCERYTLDDCHADYVAVWGPARRERFERESRRQPTEIRVIGCPEWDAKRVSEPREPKPARRWLWVTRPHASYKCYMPSRVPEEGLHIARVLLESLAATVDARLVIKPHPNDYAKLYEGMAGEMSLQARVEVSRDNLEQHLSWCDLMISEDSTAGLEGLIAGKPLIHAHFASSPPVLPFVAYGAAASGFDAESLKAAIGVAAAGKMQQSHLGRLRFIDDSAGPMDGQAGGRLTALIRELAGSDVCPDVSAGGHMA